ncbi:hypothetical protein ScPMuIL_015441 [Solemya velum]
MWYFWFVILFILMSCFGGCGYYKQRQRLIQNRGSNRPFFFLGRNSRQPGTTRQATGVVIARDPQSYYAYSNPSAEIAQDPTLHPPAYSEVVSQPGLYPYNKSSMPAFPTEPKNEASMPQPPPYSEVASEVFCPNQNTALQADQTANQEDLETVQANQNLSSVTTAQH